MQTYRKCKKFYLGAYILAELLLNTLAREHRSFFEFLNLGDFEKMCNYSIYAVQLRIRLWRQVVTAVQ